MKHSAGILTGIALLLWCFGCTQNPGSGTAGPETVVTLEPEAGRFGLSQLEGLEKTRAATGVKEGENVHFNLGSIRGSTPFFFLLYNTGSRPITGVTLSSRGGGNFEVYPASIDTLYSGDNLGMLPIIKVSAIHGTQLNGIGFLPLMPKGTNSTVVMITGSTKTASGADTTVQFEAAMSVEALVMDFAVGTASTRIDLSRWGQSSAFGDFPDFKQFGFAAVYEYCNLDTSFVFTNTGSYPVLVKAYREHDNPPASTEYRFEMVLDSVVAQGDSVNVAVHREGTFDPTRTISTYMIVSGDGAIADRELLPMADNGSCFMQFRSSIDCWAKGADDFVANACNQPFYLIDSRYVFFKKDCLEIGQDELCYTIYDLATGSLVCKRSGSEGNLQGTCASEEIGAMMDIILANVNESALGLKPGHSVALTHNGTDLKPL